MKYSELQPGNVVLGEQERTVSIVRQGPKGLEAMTFAREGSLLGTSPVTYLTGDLTLLGPITNLDDLPVHSLLYPLAGFFPDDRLTDFIKVSDITGRCLTRSEEEGEKTFAENLQRMFDEVVARRDKLQEERDTLTARVAELEGQLETANDRIQKLIVSRDDYARDRDDVATELGKAEAELATLREQCVLGEPLTEDEFNSLPEDAYVTTSDTAGDFYVYRKRQIVWDNIWTYYRWTPPVLPEPEVPVPAVPKLKFDGCLQNKSSEEILFVTLANEDIVCGVYPCGSTVQNATTEHFRLFNHPEVENTPALIAAISGEGANDAK